MNENYLQNIRKQTDTKAVMHITALCDHTALTVWDVIGR